ncbi:DUF1840 domain-containing protein [Paucibacter sp. APW11]|uniref:DUF1840 domain-containing protein n=1 Tax=Roseateles aquae TaxID=3077235 RepID=A0ABU3PAL2_9BURK|nr:DUF1840 domain-containing protein [Paucibacter sp. APW11]MDT8999625.1 DUF1840 domain-containing protein [Paucibacter sp. APW11]
MLYKFKSKAGADVIMLEAQGKQVLQWLQRDPLAPGIVRHAEMAEAMGAIEAAITAEELRLQALIDEAVARGDAPPPQPAISARKRCWPLLELMRHSLQNQADLVWGV